MRKKKIARSNKINILIAVFCVAFLILSAAFMSDVLMKNEKETQEYMGEVAAQSKTAIEKQISGDFETLDGIAKLIGDMPAPVDFEALVPTLQAINNENGFVRMGFVDWNGKAVVVDIDGNIYHDIDYSGKGFVEPAYSGKDVVTQTQHAVIGDEYVNFYGVPIMQDGKVVKVLYAANNSDVLREITDTSIFGGKGFGHIIDSEGDFVIRSQHATVSQEQDKTNIFDYYPFTQEDKEKLRGDLEAGRSGFLEYTYEGTGRWAAYTPIGINGWYVIDIVPVSEINQTSSLLITGMLIIISCAILIFLFLIFMIRRTNTRGRKALEELAYTDDVTGYGNLAKFLIDAEKLLRENKDKKYTLWYSDLKNFKSINGIFGYDTGDRLLKYWADIINGNMREGEAFGRASGDNFVVLREFVSREESEQRFQWLVGQIGNFPETAEQGYKVEMCSGIYIVGEDGDEDLSVTDMLDRANVAQKSVKHNAGTNCAFYSEEMREKILAETELETRMESALANGEFKLYFQPKIDIQHHDTIAGAEVLVRWADPDRGLVPPGEFIPLFEKNGFIIRLDEYMFENACRIFRKHLDEGAKEIVLSVNVSRLCMRQEHFVERYVEIKNKYHIPDKKIELEFTESIAFHNHTMFRDIVRRFQKNGFLCSMDDFGAGQSSLNILKDIPVDVLKLDMLFFREEKDAVRAHAVIKGIIDIARELDIKTVAEGVESMEQVEFLRKIGCDMVQGYVFAKPMPEKDFAKYTEEHM